MGYRVLGNTSDLFQGYTERKGLEGPYIFSNRQILYYDPKEGKYWDPKTDFYLDHECVTELHQGLFDTLKKG